MRSGSIPELRLVAHGWTDAPNVWWVFLARDGSWLFVDRVDGEDRSAAIANLENTAAWHAAITSLRVHRGSPPHALGRLIPGIACSDDPQVMILGMVN